VPLAPGLQRFGAKHHVGSSLYRARQAALVGVRISDSLHHLPVRIVCLRIRLLDIRHLAFVEHALRGDGDQRHAQRELHRWCRRGDDWRKPRVFVGGECRCGVDRVRSGDERSGARDDPVHRRAERRRAAAARAAGRERSTYRDYAGRGAVPVRARSRKPDRRRGRRRRVRTRVGAGRMRVDGRQSRLVGVDHLAIRGAGRGDDRRQDRGERPGGAS